MAALGLGVDVRVLANVGGRVTAAVTLSLLLLLAISIGLAICLFLLPIAWMRREESEYRWFALTVLAYAVLPGYDAMALRYIRFPLSFRRTAFGSFIAYAFSQLLGFPLLTGGSVPLTLTTAGGAGLSAGPQHSQSLEAWLAHVPGLKVALPSSPHDVKGLMVGAVRDDNPTVVILNKRMLGTKGPVPEEIYEIPFGHANVMRSGTDATIIAVGRMAPEAMVAAASLAEAGVEVEVIDVRSVQPLDSATILDSVRRTNRALVVHEAVTFGGIGAEISSQIQEEAFDFLDAPVLRVGAPFSPVPFSPVLERAYIPDSNRIANGVRHLLERSGA